MLYLDKFIELKEYMSIGQAAEKLGYSHEGIRKLIITDELKPVYRVDRHILIPIKTIDKFISKRKKEKIEDGRYKIK